MQASRDCTTLLVPREGVNDDFVHVLEWLVSEGEAVREGQALVVLETSKTTFEVPSPAAGYLFPLVKAGAEVAVGAPLAELSPVPERPVVKAPAKSSSAPAGQVITKRAQALMAAHGLSAEAFAALPVVREADVERAVSAGQGAPTATTVRTFRGEPLDPNADWDAVSQSSFLRQLQETLTGLRQRMRAKFNRHVSTGNLLHDRWELARECNFGEGTSVYDDCLILGDVRVGRHCWVGPHAILDGMNEALTIGDYVDIGAGAHLYTHNTIERALTGHKAAMFKAPTTIGNCCFIAPRAMIAPGTVLGDHCFVAAGSYVEGRFPSFSYVAGNPARVVGVVEISGDRARVRHVQAPDASAATRP